MGGPRREPGDAVDALAEAIDVIRQIWDTSTRGGVRVDGAHYRVVGAKRGPVPAHPISIWVGAYQPRMLRLTGRLADGWLPSAGYLPPERLGEANAVIDQAARGAGRTPDAVHRLYNINGRFTRSDGGFLVGPTSQWVVQLSRLALEQGIGTFILGSDDAQVITTFAEEVAPAVRLAVAHRRSVPEPAVPARAVAGRAMTAEPAPRPTAPTETFGLQPTPDDGSRLTSHTLWDESQRPMGPSPDPNRRYSAHDQAAAHQLVAIHDHLRGELEQIRDLVQQVTEGELDPGIARSRINEMTLRQNNWTVGAYCAAYCRVVTTHHTIEDQAIFPRLRGADPRLRPVVDRLEREHAIIHDVLEGLDRALVAFVRSGGHGDDLREAVDVLWDTLRSHLAYEERELLEPLARLGMGI